MVARPTGWRLVEPLKMTSAMDSPRSILAELSPMTQRTASMTFDLPQPFGPTIPDRLLGKSTVVGSTKDLKPASLIFSKRIGARYRTQGGRAKPRDRVRNGWQSISPTDWLAWRGDGSAKMAP